MGVSPGLSPPQHAAPALFGVLRAGRAPVLPVCLPLGVLPVPGALPHGAPRVRLPPPGHLPLCHRRGSYAAHRRRHLQPPRSRQRNPRNHHLDHRHCGGNRQIRAECDHRPSPVERRENAHLPEENPTTAIPTSTNVKIGVTTLAAACGTAMTAAQTITEIQSPLVILNGTNSKSALRGMVIQVESGGSIIGCTNAALA